MQYYLFQVAIGPVQGFIASARRSRDLWFGSRLLSEVSKIVAATIAENPKNELIFPAPDPELQGELDFGSDLNVANKIVARIDISDGPQKTLSGLEKNIRANIKKKIDAIKEQIYSEIARNAKKAEYDGELFDVTKANAQIADLVELSWAAVPYEGSYNKAREKLERLMAARKNTRDFRQGDWSSEQPKSSIDGQLEGVIPESFYPRNDKAKQDKAKKLFKIFKASPHERLSGVDLLKRLGTFPGKGFFPSTSHIAAIPYLERLEHAAQQEKVQPALREYIDAVQAVLGDELDTVPQGYKNYRLLDRYDGALFYPERHRDKVIEGASLANAQNKLRAFFKKVKEALGENVEPSPYYAIICADGDNMGKLISTLAGDGDNDRKGQAADAPPGNNDKADKGLIRHQRISRVLDKFSREVKEIVENQHPVKGKGETEPENYKGALIYAGGDDVLAFLPLHSVLDCANELADKFRAHFQDEFKHEFTKEFADKLKEDERPSLSVGIAIVHHLTMLHEALNLGRDAEKLAKGVKGKNALAITINKRSGEQYSVAGQRETLSSTLNQFIDDFYFDRLPHGVAYELRAMQERLTMIDAEKGDKAQKQDGQEQGQKPGDGKILSDADRLKKIMYLEAKRILRRKLNLPESKVRDNASAEERERLAREILSRLLARVEGEPDPSNNAKGKVGPTPTAQVSLAAFIQELIVAQELAAAKIPVKEKPPFEARNKEGDAR